METNVVFEDILKELEENNFDISDLVEYYADSRDPDDVLKGLTESDIQDYCSYNNINITEEVEVETFINPIDINPDEGLQEALYTYCKLKHNILDYDTVLETITEFLKDHNFDKRILTAPNLFD